MRIYKTTTVNAGAVRVEVRQVLGFGSSRVPEQVAAIVVSARNWLELAMQEITKTRGGSPLVRACFRNCFQADLTAQALDHVYWILDKIKKGLSSSPLALKIRDLAEGELGHVRVNLGFPQLEDGEVRYPDKEPVGEIHLDRGLLLHESRATRTLIHEAGHKFARLDDIAYAAGHYDFVVVRRRALDPSHLDAASALRNADSYAMFVSLLAHPAMARAVLPSGGQPNVQHRSETMVAPS